MPIKTSGESQDIIRFGSHDSPVGVKRQAFLSGGRHIGACIAVPAKTHHAFPRLNPFNLVIETPHIFYTLILKAVRTPSSASFAAMSVVGKDIHPFIAGEDPPAKPGGETLTIKRAEQEHQSEDHRGFFHGPSPA